jgi:hypothetical protein
VRTAPRRYCERAVYNCGWRVKGAGAAVVLELLRCKAVIFKIVFPPKKSQSLLLVSHLSKIMAQPAVFIRFLNEKNLNDKNVT